MLKNIKWNAVTKAVLYLIGGAVLLAFGKQIEPHLTLILGGASIAIGIILLVFYLFMDVREALFRNDFMEGLCLILAGVIVLVHRDTFAMMLPTILAAFILLSGFSKVQDEIDAKRLGYQNHSTYLVLAIIAVIFGAILLFELLKKEMVLPFAAVGFLYCGLSDLVSALYLSKKFNDFVKAQEKKPEEIEEDVEEEEEEPVETVPEDPFSADANKQDTVFNERYETQTPELETTPKETEEVAEERVEEPQDTPVEE